MSLGTCLRVGFALLGITMASACAQRELDKKPELAQEHGYYVSQQDAIERGGVGGYIDVPSNSERSSLNETKNQSGIAVAPVPVPQKSATVAILEEKPQILLFDTGDSTLNEDSLPVLDQIASQMKQAPDAKVKIEGFADKSGTPAGNQLLSAERATSVMDYLESQGAPVDNLEVASYGDEHATNPSTSAEDRKVVISLG